MTTTQSTGEPGNGADVQFSNQPGNLDRDSQAGWVSDPELMLTPSNATTCNAAGQTRAYSSPSVASLGDSCPQGHIPPIILQQLAVGASLLGTRLFAGPPLPPHGSAGKAAGSQAVLWRQPARIQADPPSNPNISGSCAEHAQAAHSCIESPAEPCSKCSRQQVDVQEPPPSSKRDKRKRSLLKVHPREGPRGLLVREELALSSHLGELHRTTSGAAASSVLQASRSALAGIAAARGLPDLVQQLKQKNLQAIQFHPEWLQRFPVAGNSMLDIYAAFGRGDMTFTVPLVLESRSQQASEDYLMRDAHSGRDIAEQELILRIQRSFKLSVTPAQRAQAEHLLKAHQAFLSDLWGTRSRLLADMTVMLAEECAAPFSVPARILRLSEQAHELNQVLGLAMEANFQAGRKYFYELLSPWQAGILTVACWPAIPNVDLVLGALAGYGANPCPSIGFPAKLALAYYHSMPSSPSGLDSSTQITTS
ncbi:hypothetical protein WJX84_008384 [Apatococcus fuscideae]|uniref:Uncharacterized protein n=1 Tax=Apatococcus fuscideae TaxID=2026836 RepID=A0AAW1TAS3_9CHLO